MRRLVFLALAFIPSPVQAQAEPERVALQRFHDSLATISDTAGLRRLDYWYDAGAAGSLSGAGLLVRRTLVRVRLGELGDGWSFAAGLGFARQAKAREPGWPWSWFAAGVANQQLAEWRAATPANLGSRVGHSALEAAASDYAAALDLDPGFIPALTALAQVCTVRRDVAMAASVVLPALRRAAAAGAGDRPAVLLTRGRFERLVGSTDSSIAALRAYADSGNRDGLALHELAWSEAIADAPEAGTVYYEGAVSDEPNAIAAYRSDLELVADDSGLQGFDATGGAQRADFLRRFWSLRDRRDLRSDGTRLREHFRRRTYAEQHFPLLTNRRSSSSADIYRSGAVPFDDRGMVYLRQGPPDQTITLPVAGMEPNETWVYRRSDGDLLLHFRSGGAYTVGGDIQDYRLVRSLFDLGPESEAQLEMLLASRADLLDVYAKILNWGGFAQARAVGREQAIVGSSIAVAAFTDANQLRFKRGIDADEEAFQTGQSADSSLVHLVFAIPLEGRAGQADALRLPVKIRAGFYDAAGRLGPDIDHDMVLSARNSNGKLEALGRIEVPLGPGKWLFRLAVQVDDSTGRVLPEDSITVRRLNGQHPTLSDLILATRRRSLAWIPTPNDTALFEPHARFRTSDQVELYYEVYGIDGARQIQTEIRLERGNRDVLHLSYQQEGSGSPLRVRRTLDLNRVKPGRYQLEVRVTTESGEVAVGRRGIEVRGEREKREK